MAVVNIINRRKTIIFFGPRIKFINGIWWHWSWTANTLKRKRKKNKGKWIIIILIANIWLEYYEEVLNDKLGSKDMCTSQ